MTERMNRRIYGMLAKRSTSVQPTRFEEARRWLGARAADEADAVSDDVERGRRVVRRRFIGEATAAREGWEHPGPEPEHAALQPRPCSRLPEADANPL